MSKEILDRLDVLAGERDQIARAAPHQIGRREGIELAVEIDAHLGQQAIGDVVRQPALDPVQDAGERRRQAQQDQQPGERRAGLDRCNGQRAEDPDADKERHPPDTGGHDNREFTRPRLDDAHQAGERRGRADLCRRGSRCRWCIGAEIGRIILALCDSGGLVEQ